MPSKRKSKKRIEEDQDGPTFTDIFETMEEEVLIEMAWYQPDRFNMLCQFLTLDTQLAFEEEIRKRKRK
jgi:hypothetical protein